MSQYELTGGPLDGLHVNVDMPEKLTHYTFRAGSKLDSVLSEYFWTLDEGGFEPKYQCRPTYKKNGYGMEFVGISTGEGDYAHA